jgi:hypothetical protein
MSQEEKIILLSEFAAGTICELNHGPCDSTEHAAIDYLVIPMGTKDQHGIETIIDKLTIPICEDCQKGLNDGEWYLHYCLRCGESAWAIKELSRRKYPDTLVLMKYCHNCVRWEDK